MAPRGSPLPRTGTFTFRIPGRTTSACTNQTASLLFLPRSIEVREPFQARHGCSAPSQILLLGWGTQRLSSQLVPELRPALLSRACQFASNSLTVLGGSCDN